MEPTEKQYEEIAECMETGLTCFFNMKTGEIKTVFAPEYWDMDDDGQMERDAEEVVDNREDYFEFEKFESFESFRIMEAFAASVQNSKLQGELFDALSRPKPFRNFKWCIDNSGVYRQQWFDFKKRKSIEHVKIQFAIKDGGIYEGE